MLGGCGHAADFHLIAKVVPVRDAIVGQKLSRRTMLKHNLVRGNHWLANFIVSPAHDWPNLPVRAVCDLVEQADFLVAREARESQR